MHPVIAVGVAEAHCLGKASRQSMSWAARFAETFEEWGFTKTTPDAERRWAAEGRALVELCRGCCKVQRPDLWIALTKAEEYFSDEPLVRVAALERHVARLIALLPKKKERKCKSV